MAHRVMTGDIKPRLLQMSEAWLELAEHAKQATKNLRSGEIVRIRDKIDPCLDK